MTVDRKSLALAFVLAFLANANLIFSAESPLTVWYAAAQHIGNRKTQEDQIDVRSFKVKGIDYHCAIVPDGHGGADVSVYLRVNFIDHLTENLQNNDPRSALLLSVAACEENLKRCSDTQNQGSTLVCCLSDLTNNKGYMANIGDSRGYVIPMSIIAQCDKIPGPMGTWHNLQPTFLTHTADHTVYNKGLAVYQQEKEYVEAHGGYIHNGTRIFLNRLQGLGITTSRTIGDFNLKTFVAEDGTVGPLNSTPDIFEFDLEDNLVRILMSDGFSDHLDYGRMSKRADYDLLQVLKDAFEIKEDEEFKNEYDYEEALEVSDTDCIANDNDYKKVVQRLIYALRYVGDTHSDSLDNITLYLDIIKRFSHE